MSSARLPVAFVLALMLSTLGGLLALNPFGRANALLANMRSGQEQPQEKRILIDSKTQETSNGENPLAGFRTLETNWCPVAKAQRYILAGNSQTFTVVLAPSEAPSEDTVRTYPDILFERVKADRAEMLGYRMSAPNISYMEVLWYLQYLLKHPCLVPAQLIVQLNFETFRKTSIRDGMLELLAEPTFLEVVEQEARSDASYSGAFAQAIDRYKSRQVKETGSETGGNATSATGIVETHGMGGWLESKLRAAIDELPLVKSRAIVKGDLLNSLYLARVHILRITPTTKRSLGGGTLTSNIASLQRIGELCKHNGIRLILFNAPQNPDASLYRTLADREQYLDIVARLSRDYASAYFDFESSIPGPMWGGWIDGPDPIHFGRQAHHRLADLMFDSGMVWRPN